MDTEKGNPREELSQGRFHCEALFMASIEKELDGGEGSGKLNSNRGRERGHPGVETLITPSARLYDSSVDRLSTVIPTTWP